MVRLFFIGLIIMLVVSLVTSGAIYFSGLTNLSFMECLIGVIAVGYVGTIMSYMVKKSLSMAKKIGKGIKNVRHK